MDLATFAGLCGILLGFSSMWFAYYCMNKMKD